MRKITAKDAKRFDKLTQPGRTISLEERAEMQETIDAVGLGSIDFWNAVEIVIGKLPKKDREPAQTDQPKVQEWEPYFEQHAQTQGWQFVKEHPFGGVKGKRKWRFDRADPARMVAVEINGGVWSRGRHTRGQGYLDDLEKINEAQICGWKVLQYDPAAIKKGHEISLINQALGISSD